MFRLLPYKLRLLRTYPVFRSHLRPESTLPWSPRCLPLFRWLDPLSGCQARRSVLHTRCFPGSALSGYKLHHNSCLLYKRHEWLLHPHHPSHSLQSVFFPGLCRYRYTLHRPLLWSLSSVSSVSSFRLHILCLPPVLGCWSVVVKLFCNTCG